MAEIRILTAVGQSLLIKTELTDGKTVKDMAEEIYRDGLRSSTKEGGSIMRVMAVEYTEGSFPAIVSTRPQIVRP
jgi:hypothetical protein